MRADPYARIMAVLTHPMTSHEIAAALRITSGSHRMIIKRLFDMGAVSREIIKGSKEFVYSRAMDNVTRETVAEFFKQEKAVRVPGATLISFESKEMQDKLKETDKLNRRKSGKISIPSYWGKLL